MSLNDTPLLDPKALITYNKENGKVESPFRISNHSNSALRWMYVQDCAYQSTFMH